MRLNVLVLVLMTACGALACAAPSAGDRSDELQVTRVVLYQNGIGYFERRGKFDGKELKLRIRPDQINDLLTSLTVMDLNPSGGVGSVSLPVEKSSSMILGELPPQVRSQGGLQAVLAAFRGANVDVSVAGGGGVSGQVVGVEPASFADNGSANAWRLTVLTPDAELVPVNLNDVTSIELEDRTLSVGLEKALDVALGEGEWKPIELVIRFSEDSEHDVLMSYVVAMPTWKPAYRLIFGDEGKARLQGWAVVDNVSGEDWNNVQLSLTAGAPISFIVDLHTPRLPRRPDLTSRTYTGVVDAPPDTVAAFGEEEKRTSSRSAKKSRKRSRPSAGAAAEPAPAWDAEAGDDFDFGGDAGFAGGGAAMSDELLGQAIEANTTGEVVGALFRYDVAVPVTVPDRSSALVSIINTDIDGEDVMLFDPSSGSSRASRHPWRAVRLTNTSEFVIERGPLTIYDEGTFVGEGITSIVDTGQTTFIPYSLDSSVHIATSSNYGSAEQRLVKISSGVITVETQSLYKQLFTITNNSADDANVFLRVDRLGGYELKDTGVETITQGAVYFAKVGVAHRAEEKVEVVQVSKSQRTIGLYDNDFDTILELYIADADASPALKSQLEELIVIKRKIGDVQHRVSTLNQRQSQLRSRATDLRNNIRVLGNAASNAALKKEMVAKLGDVEKELTEIDGELVKLGENKYGLEVQLREKLQGITLE